MIETLKKNAPTIVKDIYHYRRVKRNQRALGKLSQKGAESIHLKNQPLLSGNVEHYYHFIFDLLMPLCELIQRSPQQLKFSFNDFGPLTTQLKEVFPDRVVITPTKRVDYDGTLLGMDPYGVKSFPVGMAAFVRSIQKQLGVEVPPKRNKILLIERSVPADYYLEAATIKGAGALRRSIVNHRALELQLRQQFSAAYEFENVVLEGMSLKEQIELFASAALVIAQHGASMANLIWMQPGAQVVEFGARHRTHFERISRLMGHQHYHFAREGSEHLSLGVTSFSNWMERQPSLRPFLQV